MTTLTHLQLNSFPVHSAPSPFCSICFFCSTSSFPGSSPAGRILSATRCWGRARKQCQRLIHFLLLNQTEKYGLSFVKLHSPPDSAAESNSSDAVGEKQQMKLGVFSLREEPKDLPSGSLFFRKEQTSVSSVATANTAARARMATAAALKADQSDSAEKRPEQSESKRKSPPAVHSPRRVTTPKTGPKKVA